MNLSPLLRQRFFDLNGDPLVGGKLYTYQAGTTTPQATYTDAGGLTPNTNPVILDSQGYADVWLDQALSYKFLLKDSLGSDQWSVDDVIGFLTTDAVTTASIQDEAVTTAKIADGSVTPDKLSGQLNSPYSVFNYGLTATVTLGALIITLTDGSGVAPTMLSAVKIPFRATGASSGLTSFREATSALTATVSSGSTLGSISGKPNWIYVYAIDNGSTIQLAVSGSKAWDEGSLQTAVIEGGSGGADSNDVLYSDAGASSKPIKLLGRIRSTQATAGTWATAPSEIALVPFEQNVGAYWSGYHDVTSSWSTSSTSYVDPTISGTPTLTSRKMDGLSVVTGGVTPGITFTPASDSAAYLITAIVQIQSAAGDGAGARLTDGTTVITQSPTGPSNAPQSLLGAAPMTGIYMPGTTSAVTVKVQLYSQAGGTANILSQVLSHAVEWTLLRIK